MITLDAYFFIRTLRSKINTYSLSDIDHMYYKQDMNQRYCKKSKLILSLTL